MAMMQFLIIYLVFIFCYRHIQQGNKHFAEFLYTILSCFLGKVRSHKLRMFLNTGYFTIYCGSYCTKRIITLIFLLVWNMTEEMDLKSLCTKGLYAK